MVLQQQTSQSPLHPSSRDEARKSRRTAYLYLFNLVIPLTFLSLFPLPKFILGLSLLAIFVVAYVLSFRGGIRWRMGMIALQVAFMMVMMCVLNVGYVWMIFYPAAGLGVHLQKRKLVVSFLCIAAALLLECVWLAKPQHFGIGDWLMVLAAVVAGLATCYGTLWQAQTLRSKEQLREANLQIERLTKVAERERISQDLHDVMGHELSMITLKSQLAERLIDLDPARAKSEVRDIEQAARQALTRVREYVADMRQAILQEEWKDAVKLLQAAGMACEAVTSLTEWPDADSTTQALAMCLREATTNLVRHSGAQRCHLRLWQDGGHLHLSISDDGHGFPLQQAATDQRRGNGINGIRARATAVGGELAMWSNGIRMDGAGSTAITANPSPWRTGVALALRVPHPTRQERKGASG